MNTIHRIHPLIGILAAGACALLAFAAASPALAETMSVPHYGPPAGVVPAQVPAHASHRDRRRHARLGAAHPDRARCRLGRSHRGRGPGPGSGPPAAPPPRPPRDTRLTRPGRPPRLDPSSGPGAVPARQADVDSKHSVCRPGHRTPGYAWPERAESQTLAGGAEAGGSSAGPQPHRHRRNGADVTGRGTKPPSARTLPDPPGMQARRLSAGRRRIPWAGRLLR